MPTTIIRDLIVAKIKDALEAAQANGALSLDETPTIAVEHPANPDHGDFSTSLPLRLASPSRQDPMAIAQALADQIDRGEELDRVWTASPGFVNFHLNNVWLASQIETIRAAGPDYGSVDIGKGQRMMVEFVSVNPTGPVHVGHTRGAVLGSALAEVLSAAGYHVTREYYINDAGSQMEAFYASLLARYKQVLGHPTKLPPNGYLGAYVTDLAREIAESEGERFLKVPQEEAWREVGRIGREKMVALIRQDLQHVRVEFDNWFSEGTLYEGDEYQVAIGLLRERGYISEAEGATWFASTALGEEKDNVLVRATGAPTYFASDIAYHYNKFLRRGFQQVIDIWGADHQGHVARMKAAMSALDVDPERLNIMISQMVTLKRGAETVRASKRAGEFVTLRELVEEVGADACRYFFLARSPSTQMEFDLELAKKESSENPVYYVQYAHARIVSILAAAGAQGIDWSDGDTSLLQHPTELALIRKLVLLPELVESMARSLEPHHLPHYALELATTFHLFYESCRVLSSDPSDREITLARLKLVEASRIVLARTLGLMVMSAPDRM